MERLPSSRNLDPAGIAVGLAAIGPGIGQGQAAAYLVEHRRSQLGLVGHHCPFDGLSFGVMESLCIYGLVIALAILFAHQCTLVSCTSVSYFPLDQDGRILTLGLLRRWAAYDSEGRGTNGLWAERLATFLGWEASLA